MFTLRNSCFSSVVKLSGSYVFYYFVQTRQNEWDKALDIYQEESWKQRGKVENILDLIKTAYINS